MEDIYGNLENYDEVNVVNELKSENIELRQKLGENSVTIAKLQKDLDDLAAEFKILARNYSSLLITSRAEIERKADIISKLNVEKDNLVITMTQYCPKNVFHRRDLNIKKQNCVKQCSDSDSAKDNIKPRKKEETNSKNQTHVQERNESKETERKDNRPVEGAQSAICEETSKQLVTATTSQGQLRHQEIKENVDQLSDRDYKPQSRALSIKDRRKSMPVISRNLGPAVILRMVALDRIDSADTVEAPHCVQQPIDNGHAHAQACTSHWSDGRP